MIYIIGSIFMIAFSYDAPGKEKNTRGYYYYNLYHPTSDGIHLAVDVFLPPDVQQGKKVPTICYLTRYVRTLQLKGFARWLKDPFFGQIKEREIKYLCSRGYACVIIDARGSGASGGVRYADFSKEEIMDAQEIFNWIVSQPWSDGNIGTTGVSYVGTTAELMLLTGHPAIKACVPRSAIYDMYGHLTHPGGVQQTPFIEVWGRTTGFLDNNNFSFLGWLGRFVMSGVNPVDYDKMKIYIKNHLDNRKSNYNVLDAVSSIRFRDQPYGNTNLTIDSFSIHQNICSITATSVPTLRISGWYDGALAASALKGFIQSHNTRMAIIGPWDHGPKYNASPYAKSHKVKEDLLEIMADFFDQYLKNEKSLEIDDRRLILYDVGREIWDTLYTWPQQVDTLRLFLSNKNLLLSSPSAPEIITTNILANAGTGGGSRWNSLTPLYRYEKYTGYTDRKKRTESLLHFDSSPLEDSLTIYGSAVIQVEMAFNTKQGHLFVYLDEIDEKGNVRYITEGIYNANFSKGIAESGFINLGVGETFTSKNFNPDIADSTMLARIEFLPIIYTIPAGHKIRLSFAFSDTDHFEKLDYPGNAEWKLMSEKTVLSLPQKHCLDF